MNCLLAQFPASNDDMYVYIYDKLAAPILKFLITEAPAKNYLIKLRDISTNLKHALNRIYTGLAGQHFI